jgi:hypothetical protein
MEPWYQVEEYKEKFARALADMENLRERTARAAERSKQFAIGVSISTSVSEINMVSPEHTTDTLLASCLRLSSFLSFWT